MRNTAFIRVITALALAHEHQQPVLIVGFDSRHSLSDTTNCSKLDAP